MNPNPDIPPVNRASGAALGVLIAGVLFAVLGVIVKCAVTAPAIDADRQAAISRARFEISTNEAAWLNTAGWIDQSRGIVRLPIADAMKIAAREWRNPAAARTNLITREDKAVAPAPAAPAAANPFQ